MMTKKNTDKKNKPVPDSLMKKIKKILKIAYYLFFASAFSLCMLIIFSFLYREQIINYVVGEITKNIHYDIHYRKISLDILRSFPNAGIQIHGVVCRLPLNNTPKKAHSNDTLFAFSNIALEFNIFDIIHKNYRIKQIRVYDGFCKIIKEHEHQAMPPFANGSDADSDMLLTLNSVKMYKVAYLYHHKPAKTYISGYLYQASLQGKLSSAQSTLLIKSEGKVHTLAVDNRPYMEHRELILRTTMITGDNRLVFEKSHVWLDGLPFIVKGSVFTGKANTMQFIVRGEQLPVHQLLSVLPFQKPADMQYKGKIHFTFTINGTMGMANFPQMSAVFTIANGQLRFAGKKPVLNNIHCSGKYNNGKQGTPSSSVLNISSFLCSVSDHQLKGKALISDFFNPLLNLQMRGSIPFDVLLGLRKDDSIAIARGTIDGEIALRALIKHLQNPGMYMPYIDHTVKLQLNSISYQSKTGNQRWDDLSGRLYIIGDNIRSDSLKGKINGNSFMLNASAKNLLSYILDVPCVMHVDAAVISPFLDLNNISFFSGSSHTTSSSNVPKSLRLHTSFSVAALRYNKIEATNLSFVFTSDGVNHVLAPLVFDAFNGKVAGDCYISSSGNIVSMQTHLSFSDINIANMFYSFNNFGQTFISDKNLKGTLNGKANLVADFASDFTVVQPSIVAELMLDINQGQLLDFEPMMGLSRFVQVSDLQDIRFEKLSNTIFIKDKQIIIPEMDIKSSAMNISGSGTHSFDNAYTYNIQVLMSDVLWKKARRAKKENIENAIVMDDGVRTLLPLVISGKGNNFTVRYDKKKAAEKIKNNLQQEGRELKDALRKEFGLFTNKKDSSVHNERDIPTGKDKNNKKENQQFIIQWDDE